MTDVVARGHDGDGHGDPPPGGLNLVSGCLASGPPLKRKRGKTKNLGLIAKWEEHGSEPLPIDFDFTDQGTIRPVGKYAPDFKNLLGVTIRRTVPLTYESWERVPRASSTAIWPQLKTYFDLEDYITPQGIDDRVKKGVNKLCSTMYSNAKNHFKKKYFIQLGGYSNIVNIRANVPPNMSQSDWDDLLNFYCRIDNMHKSQVNSGNRSRHRYPTYTGSRSFAETRYNKRKDGCYPSLIEGFRDYHSKSGKIPLPPLAQEQYDKMNALNREQEGAENPMTEDEILDEVLGTRRGFKRARGYVVPRYRSTSPCQASTSHASTSGAKIYTQEEVDAMMKETQKTTKILGKKVDVMVDYFKKQNVHVEFEFEIDEDGDDHVDLDE